MPKNIIIIGGGNQASYTIEIIELDPTYCIVGIVDSLHEIGTIVHGYRVIGRQNQIAEITDKYDVRSGIIAIGDNYSREKVYKEIVQQVPNFLFIKAIHPTAVIGKNVEIGQGTLIMAGVIVNINSKIGDFGFLATGAIIDHECTLEGFTSVSAGSIFGGLVTLKKYSAVTLGATVVDRITIGQNTVVGAGAVVTKSLPDNVVAYGVPAKAMRNRKQGEKFLN
jgi:sugar O-acyltransferase (sialic acid O-acetyltransferase NeuD family)